MNYMQLGRTDVLAGAICDRLQLDRRSGNLLEQFVGRVGLPFRPQLAHERSRLPLHEPVGAEALAQVRAHLGLESPGAKVTRRVEPGVDVREVVLVHGLDAERVAEQLYVTGPRRSRIV